VSLKRTADFGNPEFALLDILRSGGISVVTAQQRRIAVNQESDVEYFRNVAGGIRYPYINPILAVRPAKAVILVKNNFPVRGFWVASRGFYFFFNPDIAVYRYGSQLIACGNGLQSPVLVFETIIEESFIASGHSFPDRRILVLESSFYIGGCNSIAYNRAGRFIIKFVLFFKRVMDLSRGTESVLGGPVLYYGLPGGVPCAPRGFRGFPALPYISGGPVRRPVRGEGGQSRRCNTVLNKRGYDFIRSIESVIGGPIRYCGLPAGRPRGYRGRAALPYCGICCMPVSGPVRRPFIISSSGGEVGFQRYRVALNSPVNITEVNSGPLGVFVESP